MSLIHWWPLNGNTKDIAGGNDLELKNNNNKIGQNSSGRIGSCYERTAVATADLLRSKNKLKVFTEQSICVWAYVSQHAATGTANGLVSNHSHVDNAGLGIGVFVNGSDSSKYYVSVNAGNKTSRIHSSESGRGRTNIKGAWHHICLTYAKDGKIRMYVDAVEDMTPLTYSLYSISDYLDIFNWSTTHYTNDDYRPICKLNDVRVYDHALSIKEIREIYKANILHYDFENITTSLGDNILKNTTLGMSSLASTVSNFKNLGNNSMSFSVDKAGTTRMSIPLDLLTANQVYKFSFIVQDPSSSVAFRIGDWCDSGTITNHVVRKIGTDRYFVSANISRSTYDSTYRFMDFNVSGTGSFYVYNIQMCPVITKIMDSSGYNNDGENHGVTFTTTSPLGTKAAVFAADKYIKVPNPFKTATSEATFSMWINETSGADSYKSIYNTLGGPTSTYWLSVNTEGSGLWFYTGKYNNGSTTFSKNVFHHIAITFKNGTTQWYLDGSSVPTTSSQVDTTLRYSADMALGDSYAGTSWSGTPFTGQIADFKIHATALSANDIAEEYKTRIQIARDGSLFANRINEDSTVRDAVFDYKMSANVNGISEYDLKNKFDGNIYEEPDGSKWVRVCHHNNPASYLFSSGNDFANSVYVDSNRWFNMEVCNYLSSWELMIKQKQTSSSSAEQVFRWKQPKNPMTASFSDVDAADVSQISGGVVRVPSLYQQVSYIQTDGTAFINTGFNTTDTYQIDCDMEIIGTAKSNYWFGQQQANGSMMYNGLYSTTALEFNWKTVARTSSNRCVMQQSTNGGNTTIVMNGVQTTVATGTNGVAGDFYIFACNNGSRPYASPMRLYSFRIHQGGTSIRDFVPCYRKSDNVIGLYDRVTGTFYTNANSSGSFSKGIDVAEGNYVTTSYGGMYKNGGNAYLTANNGTNGNWWGATGCWTDYDGIPAWNGQVVSTGYYDVYVRIDNTTITDSGTNFKSFNKGTVYAKNIIEY